MPTKAEITTQFIIETVAPVFNRLGYAATAMSDITAATGLTKGAIYGNFRNKEHLAIEAFNYNVRSVMWKLADKMNQSPSAKGKLKIMTDYYRDYYDRTRAFGGCPLLNMGVDANNSQPAMHERVTAVIRKLQNNLSGIVEDGKRNGEFRSDIDSKKIGARMVSQIQGAIYSSLMLKDPNHLNDMMDVIDHQIENEWSVQKI